MPEGTPPTKIRNGRHKRVSLADIAEVAGVALATVDRVLNERGQVSARTQQRVVAAAQALGVRRILPTPYQGHLRFDTIFGRRDAPFSVRLHNGFISAAGAFGEDITVHRRFSDEADPESIARYMRTTRSNGFVILSQQHPAIVEAIAEVTRRGTPVITMGSDLPQSARFAYVGIDNYAAGRCAAGLIATTIGPSPANVVVFTQSLPYDAHTMRLKGFLDASKAHPRASLTVAKVFKGTTGPALIDEFVQWQAADQTEIQAIYNTTNWDNHVTRRIRNYRPPGEMVVIGHELTQNTMPLLRDGFITFVIDQKPELQAFRAMRLLTMFHRSGKFPAIEELRFSLHTPENAASDVDPVAMTSVRGR